MNPEQPISPAPSNNYDFIINPGQQQPKKKGVGNLGGNSFVKKLIFLVGGAVVLMIVGAIIVNLFFNNKADLENIVEIAQTEEEIIRVSDESDHVADQSLKNAAMNTRLSVSSQQKAWLVYLSKNGRKVESAELGLKKKTATDQTLANAEQSGTYDTAFTQVMRDQLEAYATQLKRAHAAAVNETTKDRLEAQYNQVQLLLQQWPS